MASSSAYPSLERKPGGPDNWVEAAGGLPGYIERIAKHLHYEKGMSISRAIAVAVNTVKRWAAGGTVTKNGTTKRITPKTQALAAAAVAEWEAKRASSHVNLAEPVVPDTWTMVALMLDPATAQKIAVQGGVPVDELHITLTFHGDVKGDDGYDAIVKMVTECVQEYGEPLAGTIGGIGAFPPGKNGTPWFVPVDVPGLSRLQLKLLEHFRGSDYPGSEDHGYTPHVSLTFDDPQDPVGPLPVKFGSVAVVRGGDQVTNIPLGDDDGVDEPSDGRLSADGTKPTEAKVELSQLLERARAVSDPTQKARIRARILELANPAPAPKLTPSRKQVERLVQNVIDLALTKDGRTSFKKQGKWKHGFVPVDSAAVNAKAKGSPIAKKRINRIFGGASKASASSTAPPPPPPAKTKPFKPSGKITVKGKNAGTTVSANSASLLQGAQMKDATATQRVKTNVNKEASRGRMQTARATKPWDSIPDEQKTIRNGKKYVVAIFGGQQQLTEWVGPGDVGQAKDDRADQKYDSLTAEDAKDFSTAELRKLLAIPGQPANVKKVLNAALVAATIKKQKGI